MNILIVEDSETIRSELRALLEKKGFEVFEAENGLEGVTFLEESNHEIHLIISDLEMPEMDGEEFLKKRQTMEKFKKIPCLIYTSNIKPGLRDNLKELGIQAILPKPLREKHILKIIESILSKR